MAGLYIHIPFCKSRCVYCGFYSTVNMELRQRYVDAVCREWLMRRAELTEPADTIYIGGGTPSQLNAEQLRQVLAALPPAEAEVTIEVNPDDVTISYAEALPPSVNRVSMGAQTFDDGRLRFLHRRHTARQVREAVGILRRAGIQNISVDLMYGFPGETLDDWRRDIDAALALCPDHLSAYCLMVEEGTALYEQMRNEKSGMRNEEWETRNEESSEVERQMYYTLIDRLTAAGYEHYEISNFARPGRRSRHNSGYWRDVPYIGLGAAAHSYDGRRRSWNVSDIRHYIEAIERGERPCEEEPLDDDTHYNDRVTTALRTNDGLDLTTLQDKHRRYCITEARRSLDAGLLSLEGDTLRLTRQGLFVSDYVMSSLMYV